MKRHNKTTTQLQVEFETKVTGMLAALNRTPVVWEESFLEVGGVFPRGSALVEVWSNSTTVHAATSSGLDVLVAYQFYLDRQVWTV